MERLTFTLEQLRELRTRTLSVAQMPLVQYTPQMINLMRSVDSKHQSAQFVVIENKLNRQSHLYSERLASVLSIIQMSGGKTVLDIGCGEGMLLRALSLHGGMKRIVGVDMNARQLRLARCLTADWPQVELKRLDITTDDVASLRGFDIITLIEVIEHVKDPGWVRHVFLLEPKVLIITTPNRQFNVLRGSRPTYANGLRHPDHAFEFTSDEFGLWAKMHARAYGYSVYLLPVGPSDLEHGSHGLMAVFQKLDGTDGSSR